MGAHAFGTTIKINGDTIAELENIGGVSVRTEMADVSHHASANAFRERVAGMLDAGAVPISGNFLPTDATGQIALQALQLTRGTGVFVITLPAAFATTFTFTAYVEECKIGDFPINGKVPFSASLSITGKPVLALTASNNITVLTVTDDVGAATLFPVFAAGTREYVVVTAAAAVTYHVNATFAAGTCTLVDGNGGSQTLTSTVDSSEIAIDDASFHTDTLTVQEAGKVAVVYTLHIQNA
ncbi:MAG: hypothetical protein WC683_09780 [bacterium]